MSGMPPPPGLRSLNHGLGSSRTPGDSYGGATTAAGAAAATTTIHPALAARNPTMSAYATSPTLNAPNAIRPTDTVMPSPSSDSGNSISVAGFKVTTHKLPILNSGEIDAMTAKLGIAPPEMIFGNNSVKIEREVEGKGGEGFKIEFVALDALDLVDKTGTNLKVAYSEAWHKQRQGMQMGIKEVVKPFDWTYSTSYTGTSPAVFIKTSEAIPLDKLRKPDPILFFDDVMLYEDELADNGMSMLSVKIRVMPARLLLLCRFYLRLDDVVFRVRDTRVYVEFSENVVIREYTAREDSFQNVKQKLAPYKDDIAAIMRDSNQISELLPIVEQKRDRLVLR